MQRHRASRTGLFLIELILSIFFFTASAAIALELFAQSHLVGERTVSINRALLHTQNISEVFLASNGDFAAVRSLYGSETADIPGIADHAVLLLFDKDWVITADTANARYSVLADYARDADFAYITVYTNQFDPAVMTHISSGDYQSELLFTGYIHHQQVKKYLPSGRE